MKAYSTQWGLLLGLLGFVGASAHAGVASADAADAQKADSLYVGDAAGNTVKRFDAVTGAFQGTFVSAGSGGLDGPRGLLLDSPPGDCNDDGVVAVNELVLAVNVALGGSSVSACAAADGNDDGMLAINELVAAVTCALNNCSGDVLIINQNAHGTVNGEVFRYDGKNGAFAKPIIPATDPNAPYAPRGLLLWHHEVLFVTDQGNAPGYGKLLAFTKDGTFLANLTPNGGKIGFDRLGNDLGQDVDHGLSPGPVPYKDEFYPSGMAIGPDGKLYVAVRYFNLCGGAILRWDPATGNFLDVFVSNSGNCIENVNDLHRPEGLAFGPDGNLYVTSRFADATDTDKIVIFQGPGGANPGARLDRIDLDQPGQPSASAQTLLFGPDGRLFVPINDIDSINNNDSDRGPNTGALRRYNVETKEFDLFVPPSAQGGSLASPWYLTFGRTDPATLAYLGD